MIPGLPEISPGNILRSLALGRCVLKLELLCQKILYLTVCRRAERIIEYSFVLKNLPPPTTHNLVLDVGCVDSLLSHELLSRGYSVIGINIREYSWKPEGMLFIKADLLRRLPIPDSSVDIVVAVSTIEHVGLSSYGQRNFDIDEDFKAMAELRRILRRGGYLFLTVPFRGVGSTITIPNFQRVYGLERLNRLVEGLAVVKEEYRLPRVKKRRLYWLNLPRVLIEGKHIISSLPGLACLMLVKE